ncbi:unnamed protein product [Cladocopium goreaui]|uniref:Intracellular endo-alpha-(1->5)-L-arabinanase n=1 Tax=Cladocopium goreaui TaxID=2562237 RepID=A0A9P1D5H4_9DINO|nr:unnamed protein product [Cladocopium goreaui]
MSRREEVWERKRQAFLARQNGDAASAVSRNSGVSRVRGPAGPGVQGEPRASSPLSRLVDEGFPETALPTQGTDSRQYGMQAYAQGGSRPNSRQQQPQPAAPAQQVGFHSGVAQEWSNNVQRNIVVHQQQNDPNFAGPKKPQGYRVSQAPGGPTSINLSWNDAPNRAASPGKMRPEVMPPAGRAPSPGARFEAAQAFGGAPARAASPADRRYEAVNGAVSGVHGVHQGRHGEAPAQPFAGARAPSPASRYEANLHAAMNGANHGAGQRPSLGEGAAGLAAPPQQRHPCYGDPQVGFSAQPRYGEAHGRHPCAGDPQAPAAGARPAPAPQVRHPCYGDPQAPSKRTPSPGGRRVEAHPANEALPAAGFQAQPNRGGGAPYAYDGAGGGLPPPLPRQVQEPPYGRDPPGHHPPITREPGRVSSNAYACGGNQNCGNVITDRRSTRVSHPPGGGSSICFG